MPSEFEDGVQLAPSGTQTLVESGGTLQTQDETGSQTEGIDPASVAYTPTTPADWPEVTDPTEVENAIDLLAARTALLGGGAGVINDTQAVSGIAATQTTSTSYVDIPGMTLTTSNDDSGTSIYVIMFHCQAAQSHSSRSIFFQVLVDGVIEPTSVREVKLSSSNSAVAAGTFSWKQGVGDGKIIKIQWKVSAKTATLSGRTLIIQGSESAV